MSRLAVRLCLTRRFKVSLYEADQHEVNYNDLDRYGTSVFQTWNGKLSTKKNSNRYPLIVCNVQPIDTRYSLGHLIKAGLDLSHLHSQ